MKQISCSLKKNRYLLIDESCGQNKTKTNEAEREKKRVRTWTWWVPACSGAPRGPTWALCFRFRGRAAGGSPAGCWPPGRGAAAGAPPCSAPSTPLGTASRERFDLTKKHTAISQFNAAALGNNRERELSLPITFTHYGELPLSWRRLGGTWPGPATAAGRPTSRGPWAGRPVVSRRPTAAAPRPTWWTSLTAASHCWATGVWQSARLQGPLPRSG